MLTRRQFHGRVSAAVATSLAAMTPSRSDETTKPKYPPGRFLDFHTHLGPVTNYKPALTAEELLRWMDASDVAQACVLPLSSPEASAYLVTSDFVLTATQPFRDRLIPFCSIDPRTDYAGGPRGLLDMLKRYVDAGACGFGEHKTGIAIDDPRNMKLYEACAALKLPVLIHLDGVRNRDQPGLPGLAKIAATFPETNFLGHAFGWWSSLSGGVTQADLGRSPPPTPVQPGGAIDALMDKYPNIYGDLSATSGAVAIRRDLKFGRDFLIRRADRLVFGTDYFSVGQNVLQFDLYRELDLPADVAQRIFRDNARKLLGL